MTTETSQETKPASDSKVLVIEEGHIQEFPVDGGPSEFRGKWQLKQELGLPDANNDSVVSAVYDFVAEYNPPGSVAIVRITHGESIRYFQYHPTYGAVPGVEIAQNEKGDLELKEIWPYQEQVGGEWVVPHILPDGHLSPMCYVEPSLPGGFKMGDEDSPEKDRKTVEVPGGFMFMYPTTVAEWNYFCEDTKRTDAKPVKVDRSGTMIDVSNHPVTNVSFHDAKAYATWAGVGIPTEEEWERAARGNDGRIYPWGNETPNDDLCCSSIVAPRAGTDPVDAHPKGKSPYGICDMSGNVWEWTSTYF